MMRRDGTWPVSAIPGLLSLLFVSAIPLAATADDGWVSEFVDDLASQRFSLAYDPLDGQPSVAYFDDYKREVKVAHWNGMTWDVTSFGLDSGNAGAGISLVYHDGFDAGLAHLSVDGKLLFRECLSRDASGSCVWTGATELDSKCVGDLSLAYDSDGDPAIAYQGGRGQGCGLKLARRGANGWDVECVVDVGGWKSLAFDAAGHPTIAFGAVQFAHCLDVNAESKRCSQWRFEGVEVGGGVALTLDYHPTSGLPALAHRATNAEGGTEVRFAQRTLAVEQECPGPPCWSSEPVDGGPYPWGVWACSLAFDENGYAYVAYNLLAYDPPTYTCAVKVAKGEIDSSGGVIWTREVVFSAPPGDEYGGRRIPVAFDPDDVPAIAYVGPMSYGHGDLFFASRHEPCSDNGNCAEGLCCQGSCTVPACYGDGDCGDGNACTVDECAGEAGGCSAYCTHVPIICDDGDLCTGDSCDPATGACVFTPTNCDDGDLCTGDSCDPDTGECVFTPIEGCSNCAPSGTRCTSGGECCSGLCQGKGKNKTCQ